MGKMSFQGVLFVIGLLRHLRCGLSKGSDARGIYPGIWANGNLRVTLHAHLRTLVFPTIIFTTRNHGRELALIALVACRAALTFQTGRGEAPTGRTS